jgi:prepilin-type N-terminal cleavage/methylation domain-containing protein
MLPQTRRSQRGFTLAEVMMASAMIGVLIFATVTMTSTGLKLTKVNMDKQFATQKAISMIEEMKALVQVNTGANITVIDGLDDDVHYEPRLTTTGLKTAPPTDTVSGNTLNGPGYALGTGGASGFLWPVTPIPVGAGWLYSRQISVKPLTNPNDPTQIVSSTDVRLVRVRVFKNDVGGPRLLSEVASVIRTLSVSFPPAQVYDVYCVAAENVPGWWVNMAALVPFVQAAINDLQDRHPGLQFHQHWITKLAFGRDTQYRPYINQTVPAADRAANRPAALPFAYIYPGAFPPNYTTSTGSVVASPAAFYYSPSNFAATLNDDTAGGVLNPFDATLNPIPYAAADMFNHAMRYYQERDLWNRRSAVIGAPVAPALVGSIAYPTEADEPTLRLLLDDMYMNPNKYLNALVINLHGELLPMPPTRNYSDPAKKPDQYKTNGVRVVTHPEKLAYDNSGSVSLRVYSFVTKPNVTGVVTPITYTGPALDGVNPLPLTKEFLREPITVVIRGVNWDPALAPSCVAPGVATTAATNCVAGITGGVDFDPSTIARSGPACDGVAACTTGTFSEREPYSSITAMPTSDSGVANTHRMFYQRTYINPVAPATVGDTVIKLYNSPLVSPCVPDPGDCTIDQKSGLVLPNQGSGGIEHKVDAVAFALAPPVDKQLWSKRLYGLEYIPSPMENFAQATAQQPFARDLDSAGPMTKNTARWVLTIPKTALTDNGVLQVETYIGNFTPVSTPLVLGRPTNGTPLALTAPLVTGTFNPPYTEPPNQSMTFAWRGDNSFLYGNPAAAPVVPPALPLSERFQMIGDPRHEPYADVKKPHANNGGAWPAGNVDANLGMGYNRYFDDFEDGDSNETAAWMVGRKGAVPATTFAFTATNNNFVIRVDGNVTPRSTTIPVSSKTLTQIVTTLNGAASFSPYAVADLIPTCTVSCAGVTQYLRIQSKNTTPSSSVQFDSSGANDAGPLLGFNDSPVAPSWSGWNYTSGLVAFGIKNSGLIAGGTTDDDGWNTSAGQLEIDVPRLFQDVRSALMRSNSVYTTMTGWAYYYLGIGGEIGYDSANGWPDSVPVSRRPFEGTDAVKYYEQSILPGDSTCGVKYIQEADGSWWSMNWIGELYPDDRYDNGTANDWKSLGNLPAPNPTAAPAESATKNDRFRRVRRDPNSGTAVAMNYLVANDFGNPTHTLGTTFGPSVRRTSQQGTATFAWADKDSTLRTSGSATATLVVAGGATPATANGGAEMAANFNFPLDSPIDAQRNFVINGAHYTPNDSLDTLQPMYGPITTITDQWGAKQLGYFYKADTGNIASELFAIRDPNSQDVLFDVQNGFSPSGVAGTDFIARWSFLTLVQGFLQAGQYNGGANPATTQVPRVTITSPNPNTNTTNPSSLIITWALSWQRWDGRPYTSDYPAGFSELASDLTYFVLYSGDNGITWKYAQNDSAATPGLRPDRDINGVVIAGDVRAVTGTAAGGTYTWTGIANVPVAPVKSGAYIIRVEAYRNKLALHYAQHQYQIFINRP